MLGKDSKVERKRYSRKFQRMAVERMRSCDNIGGLAKELGVGRRCLYKWQAKPNRKQIREWAKLRNPELTVVQASFDTLHQEIRLE